MLSRVADSIYWMNRYLERAENVARFIDVNHNLTLGEGGELSNQWAPLVYTTRDQEDFAGRYGEPSRQTVLRLRAVDRENPNWVAASVATARENAHHVRATLSTPL